MSFHRPVALLALLLALPAQADEILVRRSPPSSMKSVFPAPDTGPDVKQAMQAVMEVKGWGPLPTKPVDLMQELGVKVELCRHDTEFGHGNYAYTTTCFQTGAADGNLFVGEDDDYRAYFEKKWSGKRAALRVLARTGSDVIVEQFHTALVQGDVAYIWFLYSQKDGCKHPRNWRLVRVTKKGDLTWLGDDLEEAGGESKELKGKCINNKPDKRRR